MRTIKTGHPGKIADKKSDVLANWSLGKTFFRQYFLVPMDSIGIVYQDDLAFSEKNPIVRNLL